LEKEIVHRIWCPPDSAWSRWVKPVLFAFMDSPLPSEPTRSKPLDASWVPAPGGFAIVVDLPGPDGVVWGMELARRGYRPVPVYNALPFPLREKSFAPEKRSKSTVNVVQILAALFGETSSLEQLRLSPVAPPAFLLDADRRIARIDPLAGVFDNRSVCFETDFPTSEFLVSHNIQQAIVLQHDSDVAGDLSAILLSWQEHGIRIFQKKASVAGSAIPVTVRKPSMLRRAWFHVSVFLGLRRGELGAFGKIVPSAG
jgi:hypothetical protein